MLWKNYFTDQRKPGLVMQFHFMIMGYFIFFIYMRNLFLHFYCSGQCVASGGGMVFMMRKEPAPDGLAL